MFQRKVEELTWQDVRAEVQRINPELAEIIDKINPDKRYKLIKATYQFGDLIVKDGILQLPLGDKELTPITAANLDRSLKEQLGYTTIPLSLLLTKSSEVFVRDDPRVIPLNMLSPGEFFGTFETLNYVFHRVSNPIWNVSAGARSIFMLPKITEAGGFKRLKHTYRLPSEAHLKYLHDHWPIFRQIANHQNFTQAWTSEILLFSKEWLTTEVNDLDWSKFHHYLFKQAWDQSQYAIDKIQFGLFWQSFIKAINNRRLKPETYLTDTIRHLLLIATGGAPAFNVADNQQLAAPIEGLQKAIVDIYQLKSYLPTIVSPCVLNKKAGNDAVYYSFGLPTLLEGTPIGNRSATTIIMDLKDIKRLIETFLRELKPEQNLISHVYFQYFHAEEDKYGEVQSSKTITQIDPGFLTDAQRFPDRVFCSTSPFWKGCIRISLNASQ